MSTIDEPMKFRPNDCMRCGHDIRYHKMIRDGKKYLPCIRKKPYKLADGADIKLGMQVWHSHPWDKDHKIITGMVRFISKFGGLTLWRYPEDRDPDRIWDLAHDGHFTARFSCYSSLENLQQAIEKIKTKNAQLEKWREKHKV